MLNQHSPRVAPYPNWSRTRHCIYFLKGYPNLKIHFWSVYFTYTSSLLVPFKNPPLYKCLTGEGQSGCQPPAQQFLQLLISQSSHSLQKKIMKKNVNKIRKEVKGLKMADFSFPGNAHLFWGWWENQSYAKWWHCESTISLPQFHTSWASIFQAQKKILSILFFFLLKLCWWCFFGWGDEKQTQCSGW